jgi:hypothetical protein
VAVPGRDLAEHRTIAALAETVAGRAAGTGETSADKGEPAAGDNGAKQVTSEYLDQFRSGLLDLDDIKKLVTRGEFL